MSEVAADKIADDIRVPPPDPARSTAIVVLGAGRSGTSAITRGLTALGVDLGDKLRPAGGKNPTGFFEDQDFLAISKRMKRALGIRGHSVRLIDDAEWQTPAIKAAQREAIETVRRRFGATPLWGYKYARTLRTLPFWEAIFNALDLDVRYLLALRNPMSVARSRGQLNPQRGRQVWSDMEWLVNVVPYFRRMRSRPLTVVDFSRMMANPEQQLYRVARDLGLSVGAAEQAGIHEYATEFLRPGMPRTRFTRADLEANTDVNCWTREGYSLLDRVAADELSLDDPAFESAWTALENAVTNLGPFLAEFDHMRTSHTLARWNPASPAQELRQVWRDLKNR